MANLNPFSKWLDHCSVEIVCRPDGFPPKATIFFMPNCIKMKLKCNSALKYNFSEICWPMSCPNEWQQLIYEKDMTNVLQQLINFTNLPLIKLLYYAK